MERLAFDLREQELWEVLHREQCNLTWVFTGSFQLHVGVRVEAGRPQRR